ncbi:conserved hypothetical protein [Pediculus humanus corporis]|uniref:Lipase n=1 Tax=Pediculus humanus subsp. corporis TaxID=121224 RepID=E0V9B7_PEDHC|nr:uncharacterized protein Phum_PHUM007940 [Pediculus humanus corporis]EEB09973.1 conserved hypothetical protein [Pediculus humanus corporis]
MKFSVVTSSIIFLYLLKFCSSDGLIYKTRKLPRRSSTELSDILKKTSDFTEKYEYKAEIHSVTTEDGYILKLHRITGKKTDTEDLKNKKKPAVLIQHGIGGRSDNWVLNGVKSLRTYFHEQGCYDLAAMTNYIIGSTGQKKIFYVGHSRGTTMALVLLSERPEFNEKFHLLNLYAPVAYIKNAKSPVLKTFFNKKSAGEKYSNVLSTIALPGVNSKTLLLRQQLCGHNSPTKETCAKIFFLVVGFNYDLFNQTMFPVYLTHFPDGGSLKEYIHYIQIAVSDKFRPYDYGKIYNMKIYGKPEPPEYKIENITAPIFLTYSSNDYIVDENDLKHLESRLKSVVGKLKVKHPKFNHMDYLWGTKADTLLYEPTINLFNTYL